MNRSLGLLWIAVAFLISGGCKKEKVEDISALFGGTEWTGEIKYPAKSLAEPYSIEFFQDGTLKWHQVSGDFAGVYNINAADRKITLLSTSGYGIVTATITQDNKLSNFSPSDIRICELNNSGQQNLDNTTWKGIIGVTPFEMNFKPGQKVTKTGTAELPYQRAGTAILIIDFASRFFCVIQPDSRTIKGTYYHPVGSPLLFELNKQ